MLDRINHILSKSPFCDFLSRKWSECANNLDSIQIEFGDFVLYNLWIIDTLRDSCNQGQFLKDPWNNARIAIRTHMQEKGYKNGKEDIDLLTKTVCAHSLFCWSLVLSNDLKDSIANREAYISFIHNLQTRWKEIGGIMNSLQYENPSELRMWMISYVNSNFFCTVSGKIEWDVETTGILPTSTTTAQQQPVNINIAIDRFINNGTFTDNSVAIPPNESKLLNE